MENRITILPDFCNGKPTIRGMGVTVAAVVEILGTTSLKTIRFWKLPILKLVLNTPLEW